MKLLWVSQYHPFPPHDGNALPIYEFIRRLAPRHAITLLTQAPPEPERRALGERECAAWGVRLRLVEAAPMARLARTLAGLRRGIWWPNRFYAPALRAAVEEELTNHRPGLVLSEGILSAQHLPRGLAVPHALMARDCLSLAHTRRWQLAHDAREWLQARKITAMERAMFARAGVVYAISEVDAAAMRALTHTPVEVIGNGVDLERFAPRPALEEPATLLFSGDLGTPANADAALWLAREVWPAVRAAVPGARLVLAGRNPQPELCALAGPQLEVTGAVADMPAVLARAAVVVSPLRLGTGIKNKVLEAAAAGKALAVTPVSLEGLRFTPGSDVLLAGPAPELAQACITLLSDAPLRAQLAARARAVAAAHYSWDAMAAQLEASLARLAPGAA